MPGQNAFPSLLAWPEGYRLVGCLVLRVMGVLRSTLRIRQVSIPLLFIDKLQIRATLGGKKYRPCTCHQSIDTLRLLEVREAEEVAALKAARAVGSVSK